MKKRFMILLLEVGLFERRDANDMEGEKFSQTSFEFCFSKMKQFKVSAMSTQAFKEISTKEINDSIDLALINESTNKKGYALSDFMEDYNDELFKGTGKYWITYVIIK